MVKKIIAIKNVGAFRKSHAQGDTDFRRLTLIHAENGRGKTTLCAIFRSFQCSNPDLILERKTLDSNESPHVDILRNSGIVSFKNGTWTSGCPNIEIFDETFVTENVHSGDQITHENKKNLCRVVLGTEGVILAKNFDDSDEQDKIRLKEVSSSKDAIQKLAPFGVNIEQFMELPHDSNIDSKIAEKMNEIKIAENASSIRERKTLSIINLPVPSPILKDVLQKTMEGLSEDAEKCVQQHLDKHKMSSRGKNWLSEGLEYANDKNCPFCDQPFEASQTIETFKTFFSQNYRTFQRELSNLKAAVEQPLSDAMLLNMQTLLTENDALIEFWKTYISEIPRQLSFSDKIQPTIQGLRNALLTLVAQKQELPLEKIEYSETANSALKDWEALKSETFIYNEEITIFNSSIKKIKDGLNLENLTILRGQLKNLQMQQIRYTPSIIDAMELHTVAKTNKAKTEALKNEAKQALNAYNDTIINKYKEAVNEILNLFGASFTLEDVKIEYMGRMPRTGYMLELCGKKVDLGNDKTPAGTACFRNTLSAGDRRTLALAFFIAQLESRKDLADLIVIFDDPFISLDSFRQNSTSHRIRKLVGQAKQVIVLSHSLDFLYLLAKRSEKSQLRTLQITRHNRFDSTIMPLDMDESMATQINKDIIQLLDFHNGVDMDASKTIRCIRPVLENHIRKLAPKDIPEGNGWLGNFLPKILEAEQNSPLEIFKSSYDDLVDLNEYTSSYAHDSGLSDQINDSELTTKVTRTLEFIGRI